MIPDETVERVRDAADIVEVIGEYVKLKRSGGTWRGPCPFHQGKNPNFAVSPQRGSYHCFKCGVSGDVFEFVRQHLGVDFVDAVKIVGEKAGVPVVEVSSRREREADDPREPLWEANAAALELFQRLLWESDDAADARAYLAKRSISRETADRFRLGYAPRGKVVQERLNAQGIDDARLLAAGLLARSDDAGREPYPRFRDRLMIPIFDAKERCVGFGGRIMGEGDRGAKYLNSPETPVFQKGQLLYNLHTAKNAIRREEQALVVEGYFDVIRVASAGLEQTVAGLGTALTEDHAALLARLTRNVFLLYDSDEAGLKATFRAAHELLRQGVAVRVVTLPEGEDPDTFVLRHGADGLREQLDAALDVFERQIQIIERKGWLSDLHRKRRAIDRLLPTVRAAADPITRDLYVARLAEAAGVSRDLVVAEVAGGDDDRGRGRARGRTAPGDVPPPDSRPPDAPWPPFGDEPPGGGWSGNRPGFERRKKFGRRQADGWAAVPGVPRQVLENGIAAERALVQVMLAQRPTVEVVAERYGPESFREPRYRAIFSALLTADTDADLAAVADALPEDLVPMLQQMYEDSMAAMAADYDVQSTLDGALQQLRVREVSDRLDELQATLPFAEGEEKDALIREKAALRDELRALGARGPWGLFKRVRRD